MSHRWPDSWEHCRVSRGVYVAEGHDVYRFNRTLWVAQCPARAVGDGLLESPTLAGLIEQLGDHLDREH